MMSKRCTIALLLAGCLAGWAPGCAGYRLGTSLPPGLRTIHVPAFGNETTEPELQTAATSAVLQELQRDGTLTVKSRESADTLLQVAITGFTLDPLRYDQSNARAVREYRMTITARLVFSALRPEKVLLAKTVAGDTTFEVVGDVTSAKRGALPEAAADLAHDIVESVVEYW